ncbi:MAG: DUF6067 family protein [Kiritimatiellaeota bacterium]|nr:DUF6067 family protein [Kiritimatiellota bacterium]
MDMQGITRWLAGGMLAVALMARAQEGVNINDLLKEPDGTEFRFSYFPTAGKLRVLILTPAVTEGGWRLALLRGEERLAAWRGDYPMPSAGVTLDLPPLDEGEYTLALEGTGIRRTFVRKRFAWEEEQLGNERVVIAPFTPLTVKTWPTRVGCVLREHRLDAAGLWRGVTSQGVALLAAPMRLEGSVNGKACAASGKGVTFTERAPDRVLGHAPWTLGALRGRTEFAFDYDGMVRVTLHIDPSPATVESLSLVIPLRTDEASLMHPVTDLLRFHYAGRIPDGAGELWHYDGSRYAVAYTNSASPDCVWESSHVGRDKLPPPFVPYIWVGGPERGICWFAENAKDCSLDPQKPMMEIRRRGGVTSLHIHFFNRPAALGRARAITFGLMATPAKPMPEEPLNFRRWFPSHEIAADAPGTLPFGWMGACYYWGAAGPFHAFYPAFKDFSIYAEFGRLQRGGALDPTFTPRWLSAFSAPEFQPDMQTYTNHINWSLNYLSNGKFRDGKVIPYTNARAVNWEDEAATFMDEWSTYDIADPRYPGDERFIRARDGRVWLTAWRKQVLPRANNGIEYANDPLPSRQSFIMHYLAKMLEGFAGGIYYDNYCLSPNYTPAPLGPGYTDDDGRPCPGVNIFGFHDLTKRTALLHHRLGLPPMTFIHMTNVNAIPMLSFATLILDHEWRDQGDYKKMDVNERLGLDADATLLLAQSTGLQSGCLAVWHGLFNNDPRIERSAAGSSLVHEIKPGLWGGPLHKRLIQILTDFGYGQPDCRVSRYWDPGFPVRLTGAPARALLLRRGGKAMLITASYGDTGPVTADLTAAKLPRNAQARDAETGETLAFAAPATLTFPLDRHSFRIIIIE